MKFFRWLNDKKAKKMPENTTKKGSVLIENSILARKMREIENTTLEEKRFIDEVTGKSYRTERGLKGAITRRLNKERKNVKKS